MSLTGKDLIAAGFTPGKWFPAALQAANAALDEGQDYEAALEAARLLQPPPPLALRALHSNKLHVNLTATNEFEVTNLAACERTMNELLRTPYVQEAAILPDACPAGTLGTITVGGVVASKAIHPGMHSADVCCSVAISVFPKNIDCKLLLDTVQKVTHFGPGGRAENRRLPFPQHLADTLGRNRLLTATPKAVEAMVTEFGTQGDGNHFAYVGRLRSTLQTVLVTHHGSRNVGAQLYKEGMRIAEKARQQMSPGTLKVNAFIPPETAAAELYWDALQAVREWTKASHYAIHDAAAHQLSVRVQERFWNEHNFVFRKSDGLFYHAKGATPAFSGWAADATGYTLIPLNMAEPILIAQGRNAAHALGFAPHGAGRNFSRTEHRKQQASRSEAEIFAAETLGIDARFYMGTTDISELPSAYKSAATVRAQIEQYQLADIVDEVLPYGCVMAGDWERNAPWRKKPVQSET